MAEAVVDSLEVVDVDQAKRQPGLLLLGYCKLMLKALMEVTVVAKPSQRIGESEPHCAQLTGA